MFGWGAMATVRDGSLAYLTLRPGEPDTQGRKTYETGVAESPSSSRHRPA